MIRSTLWVATSRWNSPRLIDYSAWRRFRAPNLLRGGKKKPPGAGGAVRGCTSKINGIVSDGFYCSVDYVEKVRILSVFEDDVGGGMVPEFGFCLRGNCVFRCVHNRFLHVFSKVLKGTKKTRLTALRRVINPRYHSNCVLGTPLRLQQVFLL